MAISGRKGEILICRDDATSISLPLGGEAFYEVLAIPVPRSLFPRLPDKSEFLFSYQPVLLEVISLHPQRVIQGKVG